jgi:hypothetical protein
MTDFVTGNGNGLQAQYFNFDSGAYGLQQQSDSLDPRINTLAMTRIDSTIDFGWNGAAPDPNVRSENFSAEWTGKILAPESGTFTFTTNSDDGIRVWVNGQQIINAWTDHGAQQNSGKIDLIAGLKYDIKVDYYQHAGSSVAQLFWSAPDIGRQIIPQSYLYSSAEFANATQPAPAIAPAALTAPKTTSAPLSSSISPAFDDMTRPNDGAPSGVPSYYDWAKGPSLSYGNNIPSGWNAFTAWGQVYAQSGWNPPANSNTRVQIRALDSWYLSKATGKWIQIQHTDTVGGAAFVEDFANNANKPADVKNESGNGGGISVTAGNGYNYHFWTDRATINNPSDIAGIYTRFQSRLVLNNPNGPDDRATSKYLANDGADYWRSTDSGWAADWSNNGGVGGGRFKAVTNEWQNFTMETLTPEQLAQNPPPY